HRDKAHPHVHVMLNAVHPETGRVLDDSFERRRAQKWALEYERERGLIFCEERLKPLGQRTPSPTRETWWQLRAYERADEKIEQDGRAANDNRSFAMGNAPTPNSREWWFLKTQQRAERDAHWAERKQTLREARSAAYREVRTEFRSHWTTYYDS